MDELFPITVGVVLGALVQLIRTPRLRVVALLVVSLLAGVLASYVSGELLLSWSFVVIDIAEVGVAAVATAGLAILWQRRSRQLR
ncbi:MAG: hypothetical protein H0X37_13620 [Herpetosiphonaceae bacterium]|nr:hypothetical protein [Herpetosiphonaceae bacterium]